MRRWFKWDAPNPFRARLDLPGWGIDVTQKERKAAHGRIVARVSKSWWHVWGGEDHHAVALINGKLYCDCVAFINQRKCSHIHAVYRRLQLEQWTREKRDSR